MKDSRSLRSPARLLLADRGHQGSQPGCPLPRVKQTSQVAGICPLMAQNGHQMELHWTKGQRTFANERKFPVSVDIPVPVTGFDDQLSEMEASKPSTSIDGASHFAPWRHSKIMILYTKGSPFLDDDPQAGTESRNPIPCNPSKYSVRVNSGSRSATLGRL
jgi:hypothetical protein